jgi:hypothetical protein
MNAQTLDRRRGAGTDSAATVTTALPKFHRVDRSFQTAARAKKTAPGEASTPSKRHRQRSLSRKV